MTEDFANKHLVYKVVMGSKATGLAQEGADWDYRGIMILPKEYIIGMKEEIEFRHMGISDENGMPTDYVYYGIKKFFKLISAGNPNVLMWLWTQEKDIIVNHHLAQRIRANRNIFLAKGNLYKKFFGYATGQFHRMEKLNRDLGQNPERRKSFDKLGYDSKNAQHLIVLLKMGAETLLTGEVKVFRDEDRQQLLDIRQGKYSYTDIMSLADKLRKELDIAYEKSKLPERVDMEVINKLLIEILEERYY